VGNLIETEPPAGPANDPRIGHPGRPNTRRHDLDALRAVAMLLGICLHAFAAYAGTLWVVMDTYPNEALEKAISFIHGFRMQLFFLVSGFFTAMLVASRGVGGMVSNRAARILVPLLICVPTLIPLVKVVSLLAVTANAGHPQAPLFREIGLGDTAKVSALLDQGPASLLEETEKRLRMTPLAWAVTCESEPMTRLLLERGADPMAVTRAGENPLTLAAMLGRLDLLKLLVEQGGDPLLPTGTGSMPWRAAQLGFAETRTTLWMARGKAPEDMDALERGRGEVIEYLDHLYRARGKVPEPTGAAGPPEAVARLPWWMREYFAWLASDQMVVAIGGTGINLVQENLFDHLWFLWWLWWLCLAYAGLCKVGGITGLKWTVGKLGLYPSLAVAFGLTCCLQAFMRLDYHPRTLTSMVGADLSSGLIPKPHVFLYYMVFFLFGGVYHRLQDNECRLGRFWQLALPLGALGVFPLLYATAGDRFFNTILQALFTWLLVTGVIGLAHRMFRGESAWFRYLADSSYWMYLMHLPLVILLQWQLFYIPLPALVKAALVLGVAVPVLLASYALVVRHTVIGRILNGRNPPRA